MKITLLHFERQHLESGSVSGILFNKQLDYSWSSHELWINNKCNPNDHPAEDLVGAIFDQIERLVIEPLDNDRDDRDARDAGFSCIVSCGACDAFICFAQDDKPVQIRVGDTKLWVHDFKFLEDEEEDEELQDETPQFDGESR